MSADQPQAHRQRDQPLLGAVVEVALDPAPLRVAGLDDPRAGGAQLRDLGLELRVQLLVLGGQRGADLLGAADTRAQQADQEGEGQAGEDGDRGDEGDVFDRLREAESGSTTSCSEEKQEREAAGGQDRRQDAPLTGVAAAPAPVDEGDGQRDQRDRDQTLRPR